MKKNVTKTGRMAEKERKKERNIDGRIERKKERER